jgi:Carboxypeptidase regulatory-like domain/TonB dependent receptor
MRWIVRSSRALGAAALFSLFATGAAGAQGVTTGAITGKVSDAQGQPLALADVQVVHRSTGFSTGARTRANGLFLVQGLEVGGPYSVTVRAIGHQPFVRNDIYVKLSEATRVDVQLTARAVELSAVTVTVPVTAEFTPTRQGVATQISEELVSRVPTFSRDFIDQIKLAPQVVYPASGAASGAGAYNRFNTITIDGANQSERFNLSATGGVPGGSAGGKIVSLDAVKEFRVMFTPTDVRQGNFAGMLVNAVTKSGTNEYHGGGLFTYRNSQDVLGFNLVGERLRTPKFDVKQYGFHVGGPIIKDRLQFFVAPEWQQRAQPAAGPYYVGTQPSPPPDDPLVPISSLDSIRSLMQAQSLDVGSVAPIDNETPLVNLFGRLDLQISPVHRFVVRQIINHADQDEFSRNANNIFTTDPLTQNSGFRFSSNGFVTRARNNSTTAQLYSNFASGRSNELIVGYSTINYQRIVPVQAPEVSVGVLVGAVRRSVTFGTEQFSPGNLLDQKIFEVVDNFTIPMGAHTITLGGRLDRTHIFNNFAQGSFGVWKFFNIDSLRLNRPSGYAVGYANSGQASDIPADFRVGVYSAYAQDQWAVTDRFTVTLGLRADIPNLLDKPSQNDTLTATLAARGLTGIRTDATPKSRALLSPRLGFNYDPTGDQRNQIRGGIGVYTGPPPYILLGNAYANTGLGLVRLSCDNSTPTRQVPTFTLNVAALPTACAGQLPPAPGQAGTLGVNVNDPDFKFPQYFGVSIGFDRQLAYNTVLTVEGLYRKAINSVLVRDLNLKGPRLVSGVPYTDRDGRVLYADTVLANGTVVDTLQRWLTTLRGTGFAEGIIQATNESKDFNYSISAQLHRTFSDRFEATVAYTYMKSEDVQSLTSDRAISNFRFGRQLSTAHDNLETTTSNFSRPHRVLAYGTYTLPWRLTDVTLYYEGTSGVPFVYVAGGSGSNGDLNGDLVNGNDPIYVPRDATDPSEIRIGTGVGALFSQNLPAARAFNKFIENQPCLDRQRGRIMERNSCRTPFQHRLDLSIRQSIPQLRGQQLALQLDFFNLLNFLNKDWGQNKLPTLSATNNNQSALVVTGRNPGPLSQSIPTFTFDTRLYDATTGNAKPFANRTGSVYQIQLSLRYTF